MTKQNSGPEIHKTNRLPRRDFLKAALPLAVAATGILGATPTIAKNQLPRFQNKASQFVWLRPQVVPRETPFSTANGRVRTLRHFRGKTVLVNFWATWCAPCLAEMPALDRLQGALGGNHFTVLAISIDRTGAEAVLPFFGRMGLKNLDIYLDSDQKTGTLEPAKADPGAFALHAMPISYLIDPEGRALGYFPGPAVWDSPKAMEFLRYFIG